MDFMLEYEHMLYYLVCFPSPDPLQELLRIRFLVQPLNSAACSTFPTDTWFLHHPLNQCPLKEAKQKGDRMSTASSLPHLRTQPTVVRIQQVAFCVFGPELHQWLGSRGISSPAHPSAPVIHIERHLKFSRAALSSTMCTIRVP